MVFGVWNVLTEVIYDEFLTNALFDQLRQVLTEGKVFIMATEKRLNFVGEQ